uniref:Matrin-type domain-containing protein n=1 Tax=Lates calcarifer TaxID=8187 RepID=A0A4W6E672_LATCA
IPVKSDEQVSESKPGSVPTAESSDSLALSALTPSLVLTFLVPKTGFFCKVCNRFFSGAKEAEINHCKTIKHYENLQVSNTVTVYIV